MIESKASPTINHYFVYQSKTHPYVKEFLYTV